MSSLPENTDYEFLGTGEPETAGSGIRWSFVRRCVQGRTAGTWHAQARQLLRYRGCPGMPDCGRGFSYGALMTLSYFKERNLPYYHKLRHTGYHRHLLRPQGGEDRGDLVDLVTTTPDSEGRKRCFLPDGREALCAAAYRGTLTWVLHTGNDSVADTVTNEGTDVLFGQDYFYEELLGLRFQITPFSFSRRTLWARRCSMRQRGVHRGCPAERSGCRCRGAWKIVFDLYSEPETIAQMLAHCKKGDRREIIPEAVEAAKENARLNSLTNCEFIAERCSKVIDEIEEKPRLYRARSGAMSSVCPRCLPCVRSGLSM